MFLEQCHDLFASLTASLFIKHKRLRLQTCIVFRLSFHISKATFNHLLSSQLILLAVPAQFSISMVSWSAVSLIYLSSVQSKPKALNTSLLCPCVWRNTKRTTTYKKLRTCTYLNRQIIPQETQPIKLGSVGTRANIIVPYRINITYSSWKQFNFPRQATFLAWLQQIKPKKGLNHFYRSHIVFFSISTCLLFPFIPSLPHKSQYMMKT